MDVAASSSIGDTIILENEIKTEEDDDLDEFENEHEVILCRVKGDPLDVMEPSNKRSRTANFSLQERSLLLRLCIERKNVLGNKKTDGPTNRAKKKAWEEIENAFNALTSGNARTSDALKNKYNLVKSELRKMDRPEEWRCSGGGPSTKVGTAPMTEEEKELLNTIALSVEDLPPLPGCDSNGAIQTRMAVTTVTDEKGEPESYADTKWDDVGPTILKTPLSQQLNVSSNFLADASPNTLRLCEIAPQQIPCSAAPLPKTRITSVSNGDVNRVLSRRRPLIAKKRTHTSTGRKLEELAAAKLRILKIKEETELLHKQDAEIRLAASRLHLAAEEANLRKQLVEEKQAKIKLAAEEANLRKQLVEEKYLRKQLALK